MNINQIALEATQAEFKVMAYNRFNQKVAIARGSFDDCTKILAVTKKECKASISRNELFGLTVQQAKAALFNR